MAHNIKQCIVDRKLFIYPFAVYLDHIQASFCQKSCLVIMGQIMKILEELQFFFHEVCPCNENCINTLPWRETRSHVHTILQMQLAQNFFHVSASVLQQVAVITLLSLLQLGAVFLVLKSRLFLWWYVWISQIPRNFSHLILPWIHTNFPFSVTV